MRKRYWITPPEIYKQLDDEFHFDFDPCPYPLPQYWNALEMQWGQMNYVNPPFLKIDGKPAGPTAFARKAIEEAQNGRGSVLMLPVQSYVCLLLEAGAELRSFGRLRWLEAETGEPMRAPNSIVCFVLLPNGSNKKTNRFSQKGLFIPDDK